MARASTSRWARTHGPPSIILGIDPHLAEFDTLRDLRNQSEYDALWVKPGDVSRAVIHVAAIIEAVHADLGAEPPVA